MRDWSGSDVGSLFARTKASMPPGEPGSLSDAEYLDVVAYMLRVNDFPAGREELRAETVGSIRVEGRSGPEAVPNRCCRPWRPISPLEASPPKPRVDSTCRCAPLPIDLPK